MTTFSDFLDTIDDPIKRRKLESILQYIKDEFPHLKEVIKWHQPMFTDHDTFIIGFSIAKQHIAIAPEPTVIQTFLEEIEKAGYTHTAQIFKIKWSDDIDFELLKSIAAYNIFEKKDMTLFWR